MTGAFSARLAVALESSGTSHLRRRRFEAYDDRPLEEMRAIAVAAESNTSCAISTASRLRIHS